MKMIATRDLIKMPIGTLFMASPMICKLYSLHSVGIVTDNRIKFKASPLGGGEYAADLECHPALSFTVLELVDVILLESQVLAGHDALLNGNRGSGKTARQMESAATGSWFICAGEAHYAISLAKKLGRNDLRILTVGDYFHSPPRGTDGEIIVDHAADLPLGAATEIRAYNARWKRRA